MFVAEASSLPPLGRVYDDACDEGLTLLSERYPGDEVVFVVTSSQEREGDILYWDLSAVNRSTGFSVRIYND
jgi:hypothetical protein